MTNIDEPVDKRALRRGLPIVGFVLLGFTVGAALGIPEWMAAAVAFVWAVVLAAEVPLRAICTKRCSWPPGSVCLSPEPRRISTSSESSTRPG